MNALSVQEQYKDKTPETDQNDYKSEFQDYFENGLQIARKGGETLKKALHDLQSFFDSAEYQTEKEEYYYQMQHYFNSLIAEFFKHTTSYKSEMWGRFFT